jgi:methionyl-tRNA formyltransferase
MRVIFMGTPEFAVPTLRALVAAGHEVVAAYTQPPRPGGRRGKELTPSPVQRAAEELGIPVRHPERLKGEVEQAQFAMLGADIAVVAAYGLILPQAILDAPRYGCLNVHASLLPRWRGAAPIQRAVLAGDAETGVCIMRMEAGLDTGPVIATGRTPLDSKNAGELTDELAVMGAKLMAGVLARMPGLPEYPQPGDGVTYASKIDKAEARLDFSRDADQVERQVRSFAPSPGAWFEYEDERYKVLAAEVVPGAGGWPGQILDDRLTVACGKGAIRPTRIQRAGKPAMDLETFLRGNVIPVGWYLK